MSRVDVRFELSPFAEQKATFVPRAALTPASHFRLIMHKHWVVLKVSLTRPWVWLMLLFGLFQMMPLSLFWNAGRLNDRKSAIPALVQPEVVISDFNELKALAEKRQLATIEGLQTHYLPASTFFASDGKPAGPPELHESQGAPPRFVSLDGWPVLELLPQLKSLELQPPNLLNAKAWTRIGKLSQLETLSLANIGTSDVEASRTVAVDLPAALAQLTNLRQLNVNNTGSQLNWKLPPLPKLEYVVLGYNLQLEGSLETLAAHSPNLHTLVLDTHQDTERMLTAIRKMPRLRRLYIVSSSKTDDFDATSRQVEHLRPLLPSVAVHRGEYSLGRLGGCAFLLFQAAFVSFLTWFQAGLTLAQPLAAVMPGHRRPHMFWPVALSLLATVVFITGAVFLGVYFPTALAIGLLGSMLVAMVLPGHDIELSKMTISAAISMADMVGLFLLIGVGATSPATLDAFLLGDYPVLAALLLVWMIGAAGWKLLRAVRLHRILAASGMSGIPGLNVGVLHAHAQPYKPTPGWSLAGWQFKRMENAIDRRIAGMDRGNWVDMLRRASPSNPGMLMGVFVMVVFWVVFSSMPGVKRQPGSGTVPWMMGMMQASFMVLMLTGMIWVGRRTSLAADFLRPISRPKFWRALRLAILHDFKWGFLFALGWALVSLSMSSKGGLTLFTVIITLLSASGFFALFHGWVVLVLIGRRLWLHATLFVVSAIVLGGAAVAAPIMSRGDQADPVVATLLAIGVVLAGIGLQWGIARKLPNWEFD